MKYTEEEQSQRDECVKGMSKVRDKEESIVHMLLCIDLRKET